MDSRGIFFVSGIDTGIGKSYATGFLAREWNRAGIRTITQKFIQTGNTAVSEDILVHRRIMGTGLLPCDENRDTMPEIFTYPASPLLASRIDGRPVDLAKIEAAGQRLLQQYDAVLLEGAGGLMVPLTDHMLTIDYVATRALPLILVTSGRLGSINHTLLSLESIQSRRIPLHALLYNTTAESEDALISRDTRDYLTAYLAAHFPGTPIIEVPAL
ncbi:MAG: dethiobiotin synthase [Akkermansia sp.]|nr:dethiobiotin synthase [Akkermansia sp.]